jgi:segregation and condensation protein A
MELNEINGAEVEQKSNDADKVGNNEVYNLLISRELSWQQIIYDLIKSEQLDPWNIDLVLLTQRYLEKIKDLEEASFHVSSKILLAAAILLRIKSEMLLSRYIKSLDDILFPQPDKIKPEFTFNLDDVSDLLPKSPLPRMRKVTLDELMSALNRAMTTEHRRIKKEVQIRHALTRFDNYLPKQRVNVQERIKMTYDKIISFFGLKKPEKMTYSELAGTKEEKLNSFMPVLYLDNQQRIMLEQLKHFDEIYIYMKSANTFSPETVQQMKEQEQKISEMKDGDGLIEDKSLTPESVKNEKQ